MGLTLVEKLLKRATGLENLRAGEIVSVPVDKLMINDYVGDLVFSTLEKLECRELVNPDGVYLAVDHNCPSFTVEAADKLVRFRQKAKEYHITHISELGRHGISHQMMVEGFVHPLDVALGTDSHATMYAGIGAFSCGITTSDAVAALMTGAVWMKVPQSLRIELVGELPPGVTAKDISLYVQNLFTTDEYVYRAVEFVGSGVESLSLSSRLVLANMIAETGAKCAVFEADETAYRGAGLLAGKRLRADADAEYCGKATIYLPELMPVLACPDAVGNVHCISEVNSVHVDQVFIGSCTNGRMEDLMQAAEVLRGRKVAKDTRLLVTPASQKIALEAERSGILRTLLEAGATILPPSCASCAGHGPGLIGKGECCVSTTNRNFKGRMGSTEASVYLGSAYTAAACAVAGRIVDPREYLATGRME